MQTLEYFEYFWPNVINIDPYNLSYNVSKLVRYFNLFETQCTCNQWLV